MLQSLSSTTALLLNFRLPNLAAKGCCGSHVTFVGPVDASGLNMLRIWELEFWGLGWDSTLKAWGIGMPPPGVALAGAPCSAPGSPPRPGVGKRRLLV